jgi:hypothetical protein
MRRRNSNAGRDVQIFFNHKFEFIINRALSVVAGNGSIPIHPNDPSQQNGSKNINSHQQQP